MGADPPKFTVASCESLPQWWGEEDSNLRRQRQQIYSLPPLAAWVSPLKGVVGSMVQWIIVQRQAAHAMELAKGFEPLTR